MPDTARFSCENPNVIILNIIHKYIYNIYIRISSRLTGNPISITNIPNSLDPTAFPEPWAPPGPVGWLRTATTTTRTSGHCQGGMSFGAGLQYHRFPYSKSPFFGGMIFAIHSQFFFLWSLRFVDEMTSLFFLGEGLADKAQGRSTVTRASKGLFVVRCWPISTIRVPCCYIARFKYQHDPCPEFLISHLPEFLS